MNQNQTRGLDRTDGIRHDGLGWAARPPRSHQAACPARGTALPGRSSGFVTSHRPFEGLGASPDPGPQPPAFLGCPRVVAGVAGTTGQTAAGVCPGGGLLGRGAGWPCRDSVMRRRGSGGTGWRVGSEL